MSWSLGYPAPGASWRVAPDGALEADGARATDADGWLEVALPAAALERGAPTALGVRVRLGRDVEGRAFLHLEDVACGGARSDVHAFVADRGVEWMPELLAAIHATLARRARGSTTSRRLRAEPSSSEPTPR